MQEFLENIKQYLELDSTIEINSETIFKEMEIWDSLSALSIIAMADDCYKIEISSEDLKNANSISELYIKITGNNVG